MARTRRAGGQVVRGPAGPRVDTGSAGTEYLAMIGLFLFVLVLCFEVYASFSTVEKVADAARTGARVGSMRSVAEGREAAETALPGWLNHHRVDVVRDGDAVVSTVWVRVPVLAKGVPFDFAVRRRVEMPVGG